MFDPQEVVIYHNPRCSKSRQTLELLKARGIDARVVEYLKTPPTLAQLEEILARLGLEPRQIMRSQEDEYARAGLDDPDLSRGELLQALVDNPRLLERPVVVANGRAALGRPPERVLEIL